MQFAKDFRPLLIGGLARHLRQGASVIGVGLPGSALMQALGGLRPDLHLQEVLSEETLTEWAAHTEILLAEDRLAVARQAGDGRVHASYRLGGYYLSGSSRLARYQALSDVLEQVARGGLLCFGPEPGHTGLLTSALPVLAGRAMVVWLDLPKRGGAAALTELARAEVSEDFELFTISADRGISWPAETGPATSGLLLVPRRHWDSSGMKAIASAYTDSARVAAFRGSLLVPRGQGMSSDLLARLALARSIPRVHAVADKFYLPVVQCVFGCGVRVAGDGNGGPRLQTTWQAEAQLVFHVPSGGCFNLGIVLESQPGADQLRFLSMAVNNVEVAIEWREDWWQLVSRTPVVVTEPNQPVTIALRDNRAGDSAGLDLLIKGIEVQCAEKILTDFRTLESQDDHHQGDARSVEKY